MAYNKRWLRNGSGAFAYQKGSSEIILKINKNLWQNVFIKIKKSIYPKAKKIYLYIFMFFVIIFIVAFLYMVLWAPKQTVDYRNIVYDIEGRTLKLENGVSYFGNEARGDFNGDGLEDIAFLITESLDGGGTFYYVVAALKTENGYKGTNAMFLGDRIAPQTTEFRNGEIIVNYAGRGPDEPMTAQPSFGISKYFKVVNNEFVEIKI